MRVVLKHKDSGLIKKTKIGFSWTSLFFTSLVPLFRGDLRHAVISFVLLFITVGVSAFVYPFIYNRLYIKRLLSTGFIPYDESNQLKLHLRRFI